jgi:hypothetical protein
MMEIRAPIVLKSAIGLSDGNLCKRCTSVNRARHAYNASVRTEKIGKVVKGHSCKTTRLISLRTPIFHRPSSNQIYRGPNLNGVVRERTRVMKFLIWLTSVTVRISLFWTPREPELTYDDTTLFLSWLDGYEKNEDEQRVRGG